MIAQPSTLWLGPAPSGTWRELERLFDDEANRAKVFFRADDLGKEDKTCQDMLQLFRKCDTPLHLAAVPAWMEQTRQWCDMDTPLWHWQMHGYAHINHALHGKKNEFGTERDKKNKRTDLIRGMELFERIVGHMPRVFTPPWNRCDADTLELLNELNFTTISRSVGARPDTPFPLKSMDIRVDLHTRKEPDAESAWNKLLREFHAGVEHGSCGVMLHHQRMNHAAFLFLERLLKLVCMEGAS